MPAEAAARPPPSARLSRLDVELSRTPETVFLLLQSHCHHSVGNVRHQGCSIFRLRGIFGHGIPIRLRAAWEFDSDSEFSQTQSSKQPC